jgi:predicted nucleic acid-binding protein
VKLVLREPESDALRAYLVARPEPATSRLAFVEVQRAIGRVTDQPDAEVLAEVWDRTVFIELALPLAESAARIGPRSLRSLDAIHLASALALADELESFITYDVRQADAARAAGLTVVAPG